MQKSEAIQLFGGQVKDLAAAMGVTSAAVSQWPAVLPQRLADQVRGAAMRLGLKTPAACDEPPPGHVTLGMTDTGQTVIAEAQ